MRGEPKLQLKLMTNINDRIGRVPEPQLVYLEVPVWELLGLIARSSNFQLLLGGSGAHRLEMRGKTGLCCYVGPNR